MNEFKEKNERAVGEDFIEWLNFERGTKYRFKGRPDRAPDLIYSSDSDEIFMEVTAAFYDDEHAKFIWKGVRGEADAPHRWIGVNPNK